MATCKEVNFERRLLAKCKEVKFEKIGQKIDRWVMAHRSERRLTDCLPFLILGSRIERDEGTDKPILIITTENKSQFPIPGISGTLRIGRDDNADKKFERSVISVANLISSTIITAKK